MSAQLKGVLVNSQQIRRDFGALKYQRGLHPVAWDLTQ